MNVLQLISADNFIAVNKTLIKEVGIEASILLGELASEAVYWEAREELVDGYFYSTVENVEERTTLTAYQQRKAIALMQERGIVDVISKKGSPPKRYIKINEERILEIFNIQNLKSSTFKSEKTLDLNVKKLNTKNKELKKTEKEETIKDIVERIMPEELKTAIYDFIDMRKTLKKPVTARGLKMLINKAETLAGGDTGIITELFNQSTQNSWLGIYPLKSNYSYKSGRNNNDFFSMLEAMENDETGNVASVGDITNGIPEHTN